MINIRHSRWMPMDCILEQWLLDTCWFVFYSVRGQPGNLYYVYIGGPDLQVSCHESSGGNHQCHWPLKVYHVSGPGRPTIRMASCAPLALTGGYYNNSNKRKGAFHRIGVTKWWATLWILTLRRDEKKSNAEFWQEDIAHYLWTTMTTFHLYLCKV